VKLERLAAVALRQFYLIRGSVSRVLPLFAWVAVDMVLWGFLSRYLSTVAPAGPDFTATLLGAVLLWDFFTRVMQGVTMAFLEDVWSRNFLNFFASPLRISEYLGGLVVTSMATSMVGLAVMLALATLAFGLSFFGCGMLAAPALLVLFSFGIALGILGSAIVLRLGPAAEWFIWPIPAMVAPFAGVFYPVSILPPWMRAVSRALPPAYVFESLRSVAAGKPASAGGLWAAAGLAALDIGLACWAFAATYRYAVRTGLIARYSAETVS
jgi:ABC-2 type transport system permease protein